MWTRKIKELIRLVEESDIDELEVSGKRGIRVLITKSSQGARRGDTKVKIAQPRLPPPGPRYRLIRAPYTGIFSYLELGETPLVKAGGRVEAGQTVAGIRVGKEIITIRSEYSGIIDMLFPKEGELVEEGKPLYRIDVHA
jgi:biotin carboxyl carrier protein